ncbi:hypothetical protein H5P28_10235 [Ruficoccus amylovorans]|uniref:Uncharacterized protein n=1 Tax=Ruficoccus amylovorans TaxID=1804625 RepID=A0A842HGE2_9BACT|nr:hypothetical protein [Ruficoccus amylovorans]MBC2594637.1 hypothetical protein [Ruficoccus amylovorans]
MSLNDFLAGQTSESLPGEGYVPSYPSFDVPGSGIANGRNPNMPPLPSSGNSGIDMAFGPGSYASGGGMPSLPSSGNSSIDRAFGQNSYAKGGGQPPFGQGRPGEDLRGGYSLRELQPEMEMIAAEYERRGAKRPSRNQLTGMAVNQLNGQQAKISNQIAGNTADAEELLIGNSIIEVDVFGVSFLGIWACCRPWADVWEVRRGII